MAARPRAHFVKPVPFRATGKGYFNRIPNRPATRHTGNAVLTNLGVPGRHPLRQAWLFCTGLQTGWTISGEYGQSVYARTFYPQQLQQNDLILQGIVTNQFEYDKIGEFVQRHHDTALQADTSPGSFPLDFKLFPYRVPMRRKNNGQLVWRYIHRGMHVQLYALTFRAGHERFVNAPTWQLQCKVSNDFLQAQRALKGHTNDTLRGRYLQVFGSFYKRPRLPNSYKEGPYPNPSVDVDSRDAWYNDAERPGETTRDALDVFDDFF